MKLTSNQEYNLIELKLSHSFALKMASVICWSVVASVMLLGIFYGDKSPLVIRFSIIVAIVLGIITFTKTRNACL